MELHSEMGTVTTLVDPECGRQRKRVKFAELKKLGTALLVVLLSECIYRTHGCVVNQYWLKVWGNVGGGQHR
jgi:hypothetical protein